MGHISQLSSAPQRTPEKPLNLPGYFLVTKEAKKCSLSAGPSAHVYWGKEKTKHRVTKYPHLPLKQGLAPGPEAKAPAFALGDGLTPGQSETERAQERARQVPSGRSGVTHSSHDS